jgi:phage tail-like protein
MATLRDNPYGAFNYLVSIGGAQGDGSEGTIVGGFSDVSGLGYEVSYSDYRNGNDKVNTVRHIPNTFKNDEITLKRGLIGSDDLYAWLKGVRDGKADPRSVTVTLMDEARSPVMTFKLHNAQPKKWTGPTLAAKGGGEVAMEEIHLVHEGIDVQ